jgi:hypothetical protein
MARKKNKVRAGNNNSFSAQSAKVHFFSSLLRALQSNTTQDTAPKPPPSTPAKPPKPRALPGLTISLHNLPPTTSIAYIYALIPTIPITRHKRSVDPATGESSSIVFLLFGTMEDTVRAYFGLDGSVLDGEVVRTNWVNGVRFNSE